MNKIKSSLARTTRRSCGPWPAAALTALLAVSGARAQTPAQAPALAAAGAASAAQTSIAQPMAGVSERFAEALAAYERNHWREAHRLLVLLADDGHAEAARMALLMWRHGPSLYGQPFAASAAQVERWTRLWGCGGDATGHGCRLALQSP